MERYEEILNFWFGSSTGNPLQNSGLWFTKDEAIDQKIRESFESDLRQAINGELDAWKENHRSCLAFIILVDQFTRNMYRGRSQAFAYDGLALTASLEGQKKGFDQKLSPVERWFLYMPMMHSEDINMQRLSVSTFGRLADEAPPELKESLTNTYKYAVRHFHVIEQFSRFPHRNKILGRKSTLEEEEFLTEPGSSF